ncbi:MAG: hypothetical protein HYX69_10885 [Planctomycetia bacterium]|nr:hypothetical protein [Planctomycetia bacterium]
MSRIQRKRLFVDPKVQGALLFRAFLYWAFCIVIVTSMLICWRILTGPARMFYTHFDDLWFHYAPALVTSALLLPFILFDTVRISNRFVGPIYRLRSCMRQLARGEHVNPIKFRKDDFWREVADEFNEILAIVQDGKQPGQTPVAVELARTESAATVAAAAKTASN